MKMSEGSMIRRLPFAGISANVLKLFAMGCMLIDHTCAALMPGYTWMNCVGRLAFPIFAFQLAEGALRSSDRKKYALRLLVFALLSEIPFDCVVARTWYYPGYQNVMWTLLLGLWAVSALEKARSGGSAADALLAALTTAAALVLGDLCSTDYGFCGVLTVLVFYFFRGFRGAWLCQLGALVFINAFLLGGRSISVGVVQLPIQSLAVLALIPILLYNGRKGRGGRFMQYAGYAFYPVHLAILAVLSSIL